MTGEELLAPPMQVYVFSRGSTDMVNVANFLADHGAQWNKTTDVEGQHIVEIAGRVCYMSYGKGRTSNEDFINNIITSGHGSVLEHAVWSLMVTGVSRSLTHELVRHRHFSYSQLSQRYVDESDVKFICPPDILSDPGRYGTWLRAIQVCKTAYGVLVSNLSDVYKDVGNRTLRLKAARQAARSVLPNCTETKIIVTGNARAWRHFIEMRGSVHAEPEIRALAVKVLETLAGEAPALFGDYQVTGGIIVSEHRKV